MNRRTALLTACSALLGWGSYAQSKPSEILRQVNQQQYRHTRALGITLGSYAVANIVGSGLAAGRTEGRAKYFHKMNVYWNLVNLGIAGAGLLGSRRPTGSEGLSETVRRHHQMKQLLLVNAGLDLAYIATGAYLIERGRSRTDQAKQDQLQGFGRSVIVQGGFLLAFDAANYLIFRKRDAPLEGVLDKAQLTGINVGVRFNL